LTDDDDCSDLHPQWRSGTGVLEMSEDWHARRNVPISAPFGGRKRSLFDDHFMRGSGIA
jgi:hypothetical protein